MTKAMLRNFIYEEQHKRIDPLTDKINELMEKEKKQVFANLRLDELQKQFNEHLNAAYEVYDKVLNLPGVTDGGYYCNPKYRIGEMLRYPLSQNVSVKFDYSEDVTLLMAHRECISKEYDKVLRVIEGLPNGKACAKYLKQLGFELPGEEKIDKALSIEIYTDILGLKKANV
jgi:hypothetical protein